MSIVGRLHLPVFGIALEQTTFARRGFRSTDSVAQDLLENVGRVFLQGYHEALNDSGPEALANQLNRVERRVRGFAFEGAAFGLALLDYLTPWNRRRRVQQFVAGSGANHIYMIHVGVGWAVARLPWLRRRGMNSLNHLDPLLSWLAVDGYGFHEGYFHWPRYLTKQEIPKWLSGYGRRVFDQGLGRSLWFIEGGDPHRIPIAIDALNASRHADLWSGVGLACAYAGGVNAAGLQALKQSAGQYHPQLAQGAVFAAKTRQRAGNCTEHTELACRIFCSLTGDQAALIADETLAQLMPNGVEPAYETWRKKIQTRFAAEVLA